MANIGPRVSAAANTLLLFFFISLRILLLFLLLVFTSELLSLSLDAKHMMERPFTDRCTLPMDISLPRTFKCNKCSSTTAYRTGFPLPLMWILSLLILHASFKHTPSISPLAIGLITTDAVFFCC